MYSKYLVVIDKDVALPDRGLLFEEAWGKDIPVSFVQDNETLDAASYLDVKVNKWEINEKWSHLQSEEPWIRIEVLRGQGFKKYVTENECPFIGDNNDSFLVVFELDEGGVQVDEFLLARLVKTTSETHRPFAYDESGKYVPCFEYFQSLPPKEMVKTLCLLETS